VACKQESVIEMPVRGQDRHDGTISSISPPYQVISSAVGWAHDALVLDLQQEQQHLDLCGLSQDAFLLMHADCGVTATQTTAQACSHLALQEGCLANQGKAQVRALVVYSKDCIAVRGNENALPIELNNLLAPCC
jgi:hypothetical protein